MCSFCSISGIDPQFTVDRVWNIYLDIIIDRCSASMIMKAITSPQALASVINGSRVSYLSS